MRSGDGHVSADPVTYEAGSIIDVYVRVTVRVVSRPISTQWGSFNFRFGCPLAWPVTATATVTVIVYRGSAKGIKTL